ncbi:LysR family transcriptional regulator [Caballeronia novacaledonica]|uniref:LysR family transcriptional regulator n=1 Tax=Caballeronia novacaledonica TaxID=1544861 RepID=A0AA37IB78_9BURK|nr:LysR family transcriptional regulator [Caballeronia novacaledonica]GJH26751.1 LysR family transcriptional regulator [Caballeronia novacaledonica]
MVAFVRAAESGSFVAAGRALGLSASAVGKSVMRLEAKLGVQLLNRTTRRIGLTHEGARFFARCKRMLADLEEAESELFHSTSSPRGRLRIAAPSLGSRLLMPLVPEFRRRFPDIELDIDFSDRVVDITQEGYDAVIRTGRLADSQLLARPLAQYGPVVVGSPAYFAGHGEPMTPTDLEGHACIRFRSPASGRPEPWRFARDDHTFAIDPHATLTFNDMEAVLAACISGLGLACVPDFVAKSALEGGLLRVVLGAHMRTEGVFQILWPPSRHEAPRLRAFIDHVAQRLGGLPSHEVRFRAA